MELIASRVLVPDSHLGEWGDHVMYDDLTTAPRNVYSHLHGLHVSFEQTAESRYYLVDALVHAQIRLDPALSGSRPGDYVELAAALHHKGPGETEFTLMTDEESGLPLVMACGAVGTPELVWSLSTGKETWGVTLEGAGPHQLAVHVRPIWLSAPDAQGNPRERATSVLTNSVRDWVLVPSNINGISRIAVHGL